METTKNVKRIRACGKTHFNSESHVSQYERTAFAQVTVRPAFTEWQGDAVQEKDLPIRISGKFEDEPFDHEFITELTVHCLKHQKQNAIALLRRMADELEHI